MWNAFISYRRENGFLMAQIIHDKLAEKGITSFLDLEELRSGKFNEKLYEAIDNSDNFIIVLPQGALDRCLSSEDWVRKEVIEAIKKKKRIIPILCDGFDWPREKYKDMPDEICSLENYNAIKSTQDYLNAMIDRLISFMSGVDIQKSRRQESISRTPSDTAGFFQMGFDKIDKITSVDVLFRAGSEWHHKTSVVDYLLKIIQQNIKLRVIVNDADTVEQLSIHMRQPLKKYYGYNKSRKEWQEKARDYSDIIHVKSADVPLMHRYYCIKNADHGIAKVSFYTYGNYVPEKDYQCIFNTTDREYQLYQEEFNYIWEKASHEIEMP